jgi:CRP-like cAMP-binding protein
VLLASSSTPVRYRRGEVILVSEDDTNDTAYLIWQGSARMVNAEDPGASLEVGPGAIVGDLLTSSRMRVPHVVVAISDCEILTIDNRRTGALAAVHPAIVDTWRENVAIRSSRLAAIPAFEERLDLDETQEPVEASEDLAAAEESEARPES